MLVKPKTSARIEISTILSCISTIYPILEPIELLITEDDVWCKLQGSQTHSAVDAR